MISDHMITEWFRYRLRYSEWNWPKWSSVSDKKCAGFFAISFIETSNCASVSAFSSFRDIGFQWTENWLIRFGFTLQNVVCLQVCLHLQSADSFMNQMTFSSQVLIKWVHFKQGKDEKEGEERERREERERVWQYEQSKGDEKIQFNRSNFVHCNQNEIKIENNY